MCDCVKKTVSDVIKHISARDYVLCYELEKMSDATLKRLVLRKERCNFFSLFLKGPYKYVLLEMSLGDDGVLIASGEPGGDAAGGPSPLKNDSLFIEKFLGQCTPASVRVIESSVRVDPLDGTAKIGAHLNTSTAISASLISLASRWIEGSNLDRLISELQNKWCFNKGNRYWKPITAQDNKKLCFISRIAFTKEEVTLHCRHSISGGVRASFIKDMNKLSLEGMKISTCPLKISKGATFAYKVQQLEIDPINGHITVPPSKMAESGVDDTPIDSRTEIEDCRHYYTGYFGKLLTEKQASLREALKRQLSFYAALPTCKSLNKNQDFVQLESNSGDGSLPTGDATYKDRQRLVLLKKMAKAALPTDAEPKEKEISDLLQQLGVLLDLPTERDAVYGIRYFITALLQLSPDGLSLLCDPALADGNDVKPAGAEIVKELEHLIESKAEGTKCEILESFSLDLAVDNDSFLYAWRAAYIAAVHMFGLPKASATA